MIAATRAADALLIGVGSTKRHNARCPFWPDEVHGMLDTLRPLGVPCETRGLTDYGRLPGCEDGSCWRAYVERARKEFGSAMQLRISRPTLEQEIMNVQHGH